MRFGIIVSLLSVTALSSLSQAGPLSDRAARIAQSLQQTEGDLSRGERMAINDSLNQIENVVGYNPNGRSRGRLACISNGESGVFERFSIQDLNRNTSIGSTTDKARCESAIGHQNAGLICASNGESGVFERFAIFETGSSSPHAIGSTTLWDTCNTIVASSNSNMTCVSNGESGVFERFTVFNRRTGQKIGGDTSLHNCLGTVR